MSSEHREDSFMTPDGQRFYCQCWLPPQGREHRGMVILTHGYGEHSSRYHEFALRLTEAGLSAHCYDLRGHGRSEGSRGHINDFANYLDDLEAFMAFCQRDYAELPLFLFGHSLGGLITLAFLEDRPCTKVLAACVTSPYLELAVAQPGWKLLVARQLVRLRPTMGLATGFGGAQVTHDPQIAQAYDTDPLVLSKATVGWFFSARQAQRQTRFRAARIKTPLCILMAGEDHLAAPQATRSFFADLSISDTSLICYDHSAHEVLNEPGDKDAATQVIINWYDGHRG